MITSPEIKKFESVYNGAFGIALIFTILWLAGGVITSFFQTIDWNMAVFPLVFVILFQFVLTWVGAMIKVAVAQGVILGNAALHAPTSRDTVN